MELISSPNYSAHRKAVLPRCSSFIHPYESIFQSVIKIMQSQSHIGKKPFITQFVHQKSIYQSVKISKGKYGKIVAFHSRNVISKLIEMFLCVLQVYVSIPVYIVATRPLYQSSMK